MHYIECVIRTKFRYTRNNDLKSSFPNSSHPKY